jgi:hypothetical protein
MLLRELIWRQSRSRHDCSAGGLACTESWSSITRTDTNPGRGSGSSLLAHMKNVAVTRAAISQQITPTARTHGVDPSLPSSDEAETAGTSGTPRARKPRKKKESLENK